MKYLCLLILFLTFDASAQKVRDEQLFRKSLKNLKTAVKNRNLNAAYPLMHFPFFTAKNDQGSGKDYPAGAITAKEFQTHKTDIFNQEVLKILPKLGEEDLSEIQGNADSYYAGLRKAADPGTKLYEVYAEYKQQGRHTESYFGFVFARIKGSYKLVAYYGKWPVR